jgi:signal transduction histidine kinase/CheY-like chemotaxis protein
MTTRDDIMGRSIFDVFPDNPDDPQATGVRNLHDSLERVVSRRGPDAMAVQKYDVRRPDTVGGEFEERYWSPINSPVFGQQGELEYIIHCVTDVTEFVRLKQRQSEHQQLTDALRTRSGQMEAEIMRRAQDIQEANRQLRAVQAELEQRVQERTAELAHTNAALREEMAQSHRLEEQFRQAQKMEAIGTLAGGIAHDFNNLLTVICGCSELFLETVPRTGDDRGLIEQVQKAGMQAAALTRQLLAFSRQQVLELKRLDLNEIVGDTERMLRRLIGEDISLAAVLDDQLRPVKADAGQIEQVIMNLAVNARDAMPRGGQLTIETANVTLDESYAQSHTEVQPGSFVMLAVSDTGCGMDAVTKTRIFDPFFTTKEKGKGTGLGLATVFGIVKQCGGHIWVYSEPGFGTTFKIYLPEAQGEDHAQTIVAEQPSPTGHETILLAEDEADVRAITILELKSLGYTVLEATNGAEAIDICERYQGAIDLLLSDVVMPGIGGRQLAEAILARRPECKVLYLSGYTDDAVVRHGVLQSHVAFLQKPFTRRVLGRKIREVLSR